AVSGVDSGLLADECLAPVRSLIDADRHAGRTRRPIAGHRQLGTGKPASTLASGKGARHCQRPQVATLGSSELSPPGHDAATELRHTLARRKSDLLRRYLCEPF